MAAPSQNSPPPPCVYTCHVQPQDNCHLRQRETKVSFQKGFKYMCTNRPTYSKVCFNLKQHNEYTSKFILLFLSRVKSSAPLRTQCYVLFLCCFKLFFNLLHTFLVFPILNKVDFSFISPYMFVAPPPVPSSSKQCHKSLQRNSLKFDSVFLNRYSILQHNIVIFNCTVCIPTPISRSQKSYSVANKFLAFHKTCAL